MPFPMTKKKPGATMVAIDLGAPEPFDKEKSSIGKPSMTPKRPQPPQQMQESGSDQDYGAKFISDIESVGEQYGMDAGQSHAYAADLFDAVARCLRRDGSEESGDAEEGEYSQ